MKDRVLSHSGQALKAILLGIAGIVAAAPVLAQSNNSASAPPTSDIGPGELSNFSLNGTVTRPADQSAPVSPRLQPQPQPTTSPATATSADRPAATVSTDRSAAPAPAQTSASDLLRRPPTLPDASAANAVTAAPPILPIGQAESSPALQSEGFSLLPWIVALFAVAGMAMMFFGRRRRAKPVGHAPIDLGRRSIPDPAPRPDPVPRPAPVPATAATGSARKPLPTNLMPSPPTAAPRPMSDPPVAPRPDPIVPGGIVSTALRPWIDIDLTPDRALLDAQGTAIAFELTLFNSGSAAARDVVVEARLLNAGAQQDVELSAFFAEIAPGDPIPQVPPYGRIPLRSAVRLTRDDIREYEIEGRKLFVPLIAVNVRYRWSSGAGQSAAGFMIGQGGEDQDKLAPLRLDKGDRSWKGLGVRRYDKGIRS
ncbi:MAG: hypothetical protein V4696_13750 [Pseudomonadota bacterium]